MPGRIFHFALSHMKRNGETFNQCLHLAGIFRFEHGEANPHVLVAIHGPIVVAYYFNFGCHVYSFICVCGGG
jgi:hypothetical protein